MNGGHYGQLLLKVAGTVARVTIFTKPTVSGFEPHLRTSIVFLVDLLMMLTVQKTIELRPREEVCLVHGQHLKLTNFIISEMCKISVTYRTGSHTAANLIVEHTFMSDLLP